MDRTKAEKYLKQTLPHMEIAGKKKDSEEFAAAAKASDVDAKSAPLARWSKFSKESDDSVSDIDALRAKFAPRKLTGSSKGTAPTGGDESRRAKGRDVELWPAKPENADDSAEIKNILIDEQEGAIGSEG